MQKKLSLADLDLAGKRVLMRVDFNVPLDKEGNILDDTRIKAALPSIRYVLKHGASLILMSHLGRPKETASPEFSLAPCAKRLAELLNKPVIMAPDCVGSEVAALAQNLKPGQVLLLENLRFHQGEEHPEKDPDFVKQLADLGDLYVNDAFGTAHRAHASTTLLAKYFPGKSAAGFLMEKEIQFLGSLLLTPKRPFYAIIGGAKISSKMGVLKALLRKVDGLFIGGGMTYTFFKAKGIGIGESIHEDSLMDQVREIMATAHSSRIKFLLPSDVVVANALENSAKTEIIESPQNFPTGFQGVDIGPKTIEQYVSELKEAKTIFWNGPMGVFEVDQFSKGTRAIAHALADSAATTIVGGGESVAAVEAAGLTDKITHISTGGGAALEYIEFGSLPGIEALSDVAHSRV